MESERWRKNNMADNTVLRVLPVSFNVWEELLKLPEHCHRRAWSQFMM